MISVQLVAFSLENRFNAILNPKFFLGRGTPTGGRVAPCGGHPPEAARAKTAISASHRLLLYKLSSLKMALLWPHLSARPGVFRS